MRSATEVPHGHSCGNYKPLTWENSVSEGRLEPLAYVTGRAQILG
jgi:hypothetical protein